MIEGSVQIPPAAATDTNYMMNLQTEGLHTTEGLQIDKESKNNIIHFRTGVKALR